MEQNVKMPVEVRGNSIENTFIIPVIFNYKGVDKCIETIYNYNENFRIYLIDQTEGGKCAYLQDKVHLYIKTCRNLGFAKAMNTGIVIAMRESEYITLCNDDVEFVHKDWFPRVKEYFIKRPEVLGLNPASIKAFTDDRTKDWMPYKEKYTEEDIKYLFEPKKGANCEFSYHPDWFFEGAMMFCTVFPSRAFEIVGLLDEGFFPGSSEDYDWCRRCYALGYRMGHFNGAWLYHHWLTSKGQFDWNSGEKEKYRAYPAFPDKWKTDEEPEPDIYGQKGAMDKPTLVVPL